MTIFLVPARRGRYELYSEAPEGPDSAEAAEGAADAQSGGRFRRWMQRASEQWHHLVAQARQGRGGGRFARWRDRAVCALAESIAEQRTLWALRREVATTVQMPSGLDVTDAQALLMANLAESRRHHVRWLVVDTTIFLVSGVLALVPGPNLIAYYFAFRCIGHLQSWRGARQGMDVVAWTFVPDQNLTELTELVDVPRTTRAARVEAIAERLNLRHLADFFDRVAVPSA